MQITPTPPVNLSPVDDSEATWQWLEGGQYPIDFTATVDGSSWSAEFLIHNCGRVVFRESATLTADGYISITIPKATSAALRSSKRIDADYQLSFSSPLPDFNEVWQGPVVVLEVYE